MENLIEQVPEFEVGSNQSVMEINFDCIIDAYESAVPREYGYYPKRSHPPQWFKLRSKLTISVIRHGDPYLIGLHLKEMVQKLDLHIKQYQDYNDKPGNY